MAFDTFIVYCALLVLSSIFMTYFVTLGSSTGKERLVLKLLAVGTLVILGMILGVYHTY